MSLDELQQQETAARQNLLQEEENAWETEILGYYRKVAAEHNRKVQESFKPLFDALMSQVDGAYAKGPAQ